MHRISLMQFLPSGGLGEPRSSFLEPEISAITEAAHRDLVKFKASS